MELFATIKPKDKGATKCPLRTSEILNGIFWERDTGAALKMPLK